MFLVEVIQLIENVYTEFHLEHAANRANPRNAGWMTVFRRWANSPLLYDQVWTNVQGDYNPLFQQFMNDHLRGRDRRRADAIVGVRTRSASRIKPHERTRIVDRFIQGGGARRRRLRAPDPQGVSRVVRDDPHHGGGCRGAARSPPGR